METRIQGILGRLSAFDCLLRWRMRLWGSLLALLLPAMQFLRNISSGPLYNLNDIGGWDQRKQFLLLAMGVHAFVLLILVWRHRAGGGRLLLRMGLLLIGFEISLLAINQKTYAFVQTLQPMIRTMERDGFAAASGSLSIPMQALIALIARFPVYAMYPLKLFAIASYQLMCLLAAEEAERRRPSGLTAELVLLLGLILPQGFLCAACACRTEVFAMLLLGLSLRLRGTARGALLFGLSASLSGVCLLALPWALSERGRGGKQVGLAALGYVLPMLPGIALGVPAPKAMLSPLSVLLGVPPYATGSPSLFSFFPRAAIEEMPEYAMLSRVAQIDWEAVSPFYTQAHFVQLMHGLALMGLACFVCLAASAKPKGRLEKALMLSAAALFFAPGASMGAWLAVDLLCLLAFVFLPRLRLPSALILFSTAAGCAYPVAQETLVPPAMNATLLVLALALLWGLIPSTRREGA